MPENVPFKLGNAESTIFTLKLSSYQSLKDVITEPYFTGLVLEKVHYDGYNKKHGHLHGGIDFSDVEDKVEEFRKTRILPSIYR